MLRGGILEFQFQFQSAALLSTDTGNRFLKDLQILSSGCLRREHKTRLINQSSDTLRCIRA